MSENFVDVVGYQLEKIHTGVIAWLLDSGRSPLPIRDQAQIARELGAVFPEGAELETITATREYSFGRRLLIDLVLELKFKDDRKTYVLIEYKTDSDVRVDQLNKSEEAFSSKNPGIPYSVTVLALGAGQFTLKHQLPEILKSGYHALDLIKVLEIFSNLPIAPACNIYHDWVTSLQAEHARTENIIDILSNVDNPWHVSLMDAGYRRGFPIFYLIYDKLRDYLEKGPFQKWAIYSGSHNPVMNWQDGWLPKSKNINLYWEFNWDALCLKAEIGEATKEHWAEFRPSFIELCASCPITGRKTANRRGTWVTAYKWEFNFCKEAPDAIANKVTDILDYVHSRLLTLA